MFSRGRFGSGFLWAILDVLSKFLDIFPPFDWGCVLRNTLCLLVGKNKNTWYINAIPVTYLYPAGHQPLWWAETEGESGPSSVQWHWCLPAGRPAVCCGCPCGQTHLWQPHWSRGVAKRKGKGSWNQGCHLDLLEKKLKKTTVLSIDIWHLALVHMVIWEWWRSIVE